VNIESIASSELLRPFVPRLVIQWLREWPGVRDMEVPGSLAFVDISGFTALTERLAKKGKIGAEELNEILDAVFGVLLDVAYAEGAGLIKWGGDAVLLLFEGEEHAARACHAAYGMRRALRRVGRIKTSTGQVTLRMSVGIHSGTFHFFLVGDEHLELLITGPGATQTALMEGIAEAGEIAISEGTAALLPPSVVGERKDQALLLTGDPKVPQLPAETAFEVADLDLASCIPVAIRDQLLDTSREAEHRQLTVAFIEFSGVDRFLARRGADGLADALEGLVRSVQWACRHHEITFFQTDISKDGGKILVMAGAPRSAGDDEERVLLAARQIMDEGSQLPLRIGINSGYVFTGDFGPPYRRTYDIKGDAVNLAARVMAKAERGQIIATPRVLERSRTTFETTELEPFMVKGKAKPVRAWSVGEPIRSRAGEGVHTLPLVGRDPEMGVVREALKAIREGELRLLELVGESGVGKSRLAEELRAEASDLVHLRAVGEAYRSSTPYIAWREVLRELLGIGWEDVSEVVVARLREVVTEAAPDLLPWLPLLASAAGAEMEPTPEVLDLGPEFVRAKLHETVLAFLRATVTTPTLFEFENAHLIDEASAELLSAIVQAKEVDLPWLFLVARREGETAFVEASELRRLELGPLTEADATALAEAATEDEPAPSHVLRMAIERSAGNPQLLLDLLTAAISGGGALPDSVESAAAVQIDSLPPLDRQLLRRASILGVSFHPRFLDEVLDADIPWPDDRTWERLAEFFEPEADGYVRFRRVVVRDAAYAGLPFRVRRRLHARFADRLEREVADAGEVVGLLSLQFFLADELSKAWTYSLRSGEKAQEIFANAEAARFYRRAIEAGKKVGVARMDLLGAFEALWQALLYAGRYVEAAKVNAEARALAVEDPVRLARLVMKRAVIEEAGGRLPNALRWLSKSRRLLTDVDTPDAVRLTAEIEARYSATLQIQGRSREALAFAERSIARGGSVGAESALGQAENIFASALAVLGKPGATEHWHKALEHFERAGELGGQWAVLNNLGAGEYFRGHWGEAVELYERAQRAGERSGDPYSSATSKMNIAEVLVGQGHFPEAERLLKETMRVWRTTGDSFLTAFCLIQLGRVNAMLGRVDAGLELFAQARERYVEAGAPGAVPEVDAWEADARLLAGQSHRALEMCGEIIARLEDSGEGVNVLSPLLDRLLGYGLMQTGDLEAAEKAFDLAIAGARARDAKHDVAHAMLGVARVRRMLGEPDLALEVEAGEILERLGISAVPAYPATTLEPTG
jgi:class 3 adenylate cyclase/tetratricopeptide (TPR) repeat protein